MKNQNILSNIESFTLTTTNQAVNYDGYISFILNTNAATTPFRGFYVNDVLIDACSSPEYSGGEGVCFPVKKGDNVRFAQSGGGSTKEMHARWYKLRDYTGR